MMSSEVKLVWHSRFWAEFFENSNRFEFPSSSFSLDFGTWGLLFNFQERKNRSKIALIHYLKGVFRQIHYAESREHISFGRKILNFNYATHQLRNHTFIASIVSGFNILTAAEKKFNSLNFTKLKTKRKLNFQQLFSLALHQLLKILQHTC